jgi:hypothetical protein
MQEIPDLHESHLTSDPCKFTHTLKFELTSSVDYGPSHCLTYGTNTSRAAKPIILTRQLIVLCCSDQIKTMPLNPDMSGTCLR